LVVVDRWYDSIGLLNIRGSDVEFNPVVISYVVVSLEWANWYISDAKVSSEVRQHLGDLVNIKPYEQVFADLAAISDESCVWLRIDGGGGGGGGSAQVVVTCKH
jgi:hypothetical protein